MNEQTEKARNANGRRFRLYEIVIAGLLTALFALLFISIQQLSNRVDGLDRKLEALDRKVDEKVAELNRKVDENRIILTEVQTTLKVIASGLDIRVEPKEQAGSASAPSPNEKLATKDP